MQHSKFQVQSNYRNSVRTAWSLWPECIDQEWGFRILLLVLIAVGQEPGRRCALRRLKGLSSLLTRTPADKWASLMLWAQVWGVDKSCASSSKLLQLLQQNLCLEVAFNLVFLFFFFFLNEKKKKARLFKSGSLVKSQGDFHVTCLELRRGSSPWMGILK